MQILKEKLNNSNKLDNIIQSLTGAGHPILLMYNHNQHPINEFSVTGSNILLSSYVIPYSLELFVGLAEKLNNDGCQF